MASAMKTTQLSAKNKKKKLANKSMDEFLSGSFETDTDDVSSEASLSQTAKKANLKGKGKSKTKEMPAKESEKKKAKKDQKTKKSPIATKRQDSPDNGKKSKKKTSNLKEMDSSKKSKKKTLNLTEMDSAKKSKKKTSSLKDMDPEFYKFLKAEDQDLLDYEEEEEEEDSDDDDDSFAYEEDPSKKRKEKEIAAAKKAFEKDILEMSSGESDSDEEEEEEEESLVDKKLEVASDDEDFDSDGSDDEDAGKGPDNKAGRILITTAMLKEWTKQLHAASPSVAVMKEISSALAAAAQEAGVEVTSPYKVEGTPVFNSVISMCLTGYVPAVESILKISSLTDHPQVLSHKNKKWKSLKGTLKTYLPLMLKLSGALTEGSAAVLRHLHKFVVVIAGLPGFARVFVKQMVSLWSRGDNRQRVLAFLSINKLLRLQSDLLEQTLKDMHMSYVRNSSFVNPEALSVISLMQHSLVEVFLLNEELAYQQVFLYIRQMAIHLRNAIKDKSEKNTKLVYNWQYVLSLGLWSRLLSSSHPSPKLQPLIYPLTQVIIGTIRLLPTVRYYPLRFHCLRYLVQLSGSTGTFIPVIPFILEVLDQVDFNKRPKTSNVKKLNMSTILKLTKLQQGDKAFKEAVVEQLVELLFDYLTSQSHVVAFPELIVPLVVQLKDFLKKCNVAVLCKQVKDVLQKAEETAKVIESRRRSVTFSLTDAKAVELWEMKTKEEGTPLSKFYASWRKQKDRQLQQDIAGKAELTKAEKQVQNISLPLKGPIRATNEERKQFADLFASDSEDEADVFKFLPKGQRPDKEQMRKRRGDREDDSDEIESDGDLSDVDDDDDEGSDVDEDDDSAESDSGADVKSKKRSAPQASKSAKRAKVQLDHDEGDVVSDFDIDDF